MTEKVLCKDCKNSFRTFGDIITWGTSKYAYKCKLSHKPEHFEDNPVNGPMKVKESYENCSISRIDPKLCGAEGKNWEPKHKEDLFKFIKHVSN